MDIRTIIHSHRDYKATLKEVSALMELDPDPNRNGNHGDWPKKAGGLIAP